MTVLKSQFQEITLGITKEGVIKMREKVEEFEANKKASIKLDDNATVKIIDADNDDIFEINELVMIGAEKALNVRPSMKAEIIKEIESVIQFSDALAEKNKKYHEDYVVRGNHALYVVLAEIYALALKIESSTARDHILKEMRSKLKDRQIKTQFNTPTMTVLIKYVVGSDRQTAANYSRVLNIAMSENLTPKELPDYISRRGGIGQIHALEGESAAKKLGSKQSKDRIRVITDMLQLLGVSSDNSFKYNLEIKQLNADKQNGAETGRFATFLTVFDESSRTYKIVNGFDLGQTYEDSLVRLLMKDATNNVDALKKNLRNFKEHLISTKKVNQGWINRFHSEFEKEEKSKEEVSSEGVTA